MRGDSAELSSARLRVTLAHRGRRRRTADARLVRGMIVLGFDTATPLDRGRTAPPRRRDAAGARRPTAGRAPGTRHPAAGDGRRAARPRGRRLERARPDRGGAGTGDLHRPARRGRHRARAGAVAGDRAGRGVEPARARRGGAGRERRARFRRAGGDRRPSRRGVRRRLSNRRRARIGRELVPPRALAPEDLGSIVKQAEATRRAASMANPWLAVGDGAVRFRGHLEFAGVAVPPDSSPLHLVSAQAICDLGARAEAVASVRGRSCRTTGADRTRRSLWSALPRWRVESRDRAIRRPGASQPLHRPIEIRRLLYPDLPQVIAIERRVFPTPWSLAMFVLELSKQSGICLAAVLARRRAAAGRIPDLLALRHRLARDERGRGHRSPAQGAGLGAAGRAVRARRRRATRASRSRCAAPITSRSTCTSGRAFARPACAAATTRTTARTRS